jgi:hypothetical protein
VKVGAENPKNREGITDSLKMHIIRIMLIASDLPTKSKYIKVLLS